MRILLVEDSDALRHLFSRVLKAKGFEVREAANGQEALDCLSGFEPDVVLTDLMMPVIDGFELIRQLRAIPTMAAVPVVVMTAGAAGDAECEARRAGAADFLAKPFDFRTPLDRVVGFQV
jgi:DNA-binding response OmpR family regulator